MSLLKDNIDLSDIGIDLNGIDFTEEDSAKLIDIDLGNAREIENIKNDRRLLSKKLENDVEFRENYIKQEKDRRRQLKKGDSKTDIDDIQEANRLRKNAENYIENKINIDSEPFDNDISEFIDDSPLKIGETGVYIYKVDNLTINICKK